MKIQQNITSMNTHTHTHKHRGSLKVLDKLTETEAAFTKKKLEKLHF